MVEFDEVTFCYAEAAQPTLDHLTLRIGDGEFVLVVGPSGAGKSTFLRCLNGLIPHYYGGRFAGRVNVGGRNPMEAQPCGMSDLVGFVLQTPEVQAVADTVESELAFAMENHNLPQRLMRKRIEEVLDQLDIAALRRRRLETLSGGERQRVAIASVLTLQPRVLVLDEPTSQLDPQAAEEILTLLQKLNTDLGLTVILSEHRLERVVQYADRMLYFPGDGRQPVIGPPERVLGELPFAPPLVALARQLKWTPLPLTVKAGRPFAKRLSLRPLARQPASSGADSQPMPRKPILALRNLWYSYQGLEALKDVTIGFTAGQLVAVMGRNGSGKTTLLKNIVGLLRPQGGVVELQGQDTRSWDVQTIARTVGYVPQNPDTLLFADTVRAEIEFTGRLHTAFSPSKVDALLKQLGLVHLQTLYPRDLSGGERQRTAMAAILIGDPQILLLDEPTRGLDYLQKKLLAQLLRDMVDEGKTVIMVTHDVELTARCADRVVLMGDGQIILDGPTREVMRQSMVFSSQISKLFPESGYLTEDEVLEAYRRDVQAGD